MIDFEFIYQYKNHFKIMNQKEPDLPENSQDFSKLHYLEPTVENIHSSTVVRFQQGVNTDQLICNCDCDEIPKLREKAHKSFMQVVY